MTDAPATVLDRAPSDVEFRWTRRHIVLLIVLCVGHVLETVDITITNVALPAIGSDLRFAGAQLSWVVNGYTVCFGGFLLVCSRIGDAWGHRRTLAAGLGLFCLASALAAMAGSPAMLVSARGLQGIGAAMVAPMTLTLLAALFPGGRPRTTAVSIWAVITTVSGALAMLAGGLLTAGGGWRWVFWVNVPVAAVVMVAAMRLLPADRLAQRRGGFDVVGAMGTTAGVGLFVGATVGATGWSAPRIAAVYVAAAIVLAATIAHETAIARNPLVPRELFAVPSVVGANLTQGLCGGAILVMFYGITLYQQNVLHFSPLQTALAYLPHTVVLILTGRIAPALIAALAPARTVLVGCVAGVSGMVLLTQLPAQGTFAGTVLAPSLILGVAIPLTLIPNTTAALAQVPGRLHGTASGLVNVSRVLGGTLGLAVASAVAAGVTAVSARAGTGAAEALTQGYRWSFGIAAALFTAAAATALVLLRAPRRSAT